MSEISALRESGKKVDGKGEIDRCFNELPMDLEIDSASATPREKNELRCTLVSKMRSQ